MRAVISVARGATHLDRAVADLLTPLLRGRRRAVPFPSLTERERGALVRIARGRSNGDIARELFVSTKTVQDTVSRIFLKIGVADRPHAIVAARAEGLHLEE